MPSGGASSSWAISFSNRFSWAVLWASSFSAPTSPVTLFRLRAPGSDLSNSLRSSSGRSQPSLLRLSSARSIGVPDFFDRYLTAVGVSLSSPLKMPQSMPPMRLMAPLRVVILDGFGWEGPFGLATLLTYSSAPITSPVLRSPTFVFLAATSAASSSTLSPKISAIAPTSRGSALGLSTMWVMPWSRRYFFAPSTPLAALRSWIISLALSLTGTTLRSSSFAALISVSLTPAF